MLAVFAVAGFAVTAFAVLGTLGMSRVVLAVVEARIVILGIGRGLGLCRILLGRILLGRMMLVRHGRVGRRRSTVMAVLRAGLSVIAEGRLVAVVGVLRLRRLPIGRMCLRGLAVGRLPIGGLTDRGLSIGRLAENRLARSGLAIRRLLVGPLAVRSLPAFGGSGFGRDLQPGKRMAARGPWFVGRLLLVALCAWGGGARGRPRHRAAGRQLRRARRSGAASRRRAERIALPDQAGELHQGIRRRIAPIRRILTVRRERARRSGKRVVSHSALATSLAPAMSCAMTPRQSQTCSRPATPGSPHLHGSADPEQTKSGSQHGDNALHQRETSPCKFWIILDNEA